MLLRTVVVVREYERGLLYRKGKFVELLPPGRYVHWRWEHCRIDTVDIREVSHTVEGQEILTSDKIGVRVTLIAQFKVVDPVAARHTVGDYPSQLYQELQLTLREAITGRMLEDLLREREVLSGKIREDVAPRAAKYGVELIECRGRRIRLDTPGGALPLPALHGRQAGRPRTPPARPLARPQAASAPAARPLSGSTPRPWLRDRLPPRLFDRLQRALPCPANADRHGRCA